MTEREIVLSLCLRGGLGKGGGGAEAAAQNRTEVQQRKGPHKTEKPATWGCDRHLGFNWKQKENNRAIHKSETQEWKLCTNMATQ